MAFCLGVAFVDFLVGRYVAGMTRVKEWELLRGAAGFLMGTALVSTVLCGVLGAVNFDAYAPLHYLPHALCAVEILLGAEVLLNLVLNFYRPRKTGETPRPAFDSRVLGLLTSPESLGKALQEALNYQFGFEVTRSWFWRLLNRWAAPLFAVGVLSLFAVSCLVLVEPQQQALVLRFGALSRPEPLGPGLHFKWPWPVETASAWDVQRVRQFALGSHEHLKEGETVLWTNEHGDSEQLLMAAPPPSLAETGGAGAGQRAPSISLMAAEVYVNYRIRDLVAFARGESEPEALLKDLAERELTRNLLAEDVDVWLGARHVELGQRLRERIQAEADRRKLGVEVLFVGTAGLHPPRDVAEAFHTVVRGYQEAATARERALKDEIAKLARAAGTPDHARRILEQIERYDYLKANNAEPKVLARQEAQIEELLQQAGGEAARLIAEARAFRHESENAERAKAERFTQELQAYRRAPELYRARRYLEVLAEGLKNRRKIVVVSGRKDLTVRIDLKDEGRELAPIDLESVLPKESPKP
ncbi:MAG: protease modulator HflK [Planctomycetota bacterium]|nr:protease modulator HflK [Planctomycetota bacterium]